MIGAQYKNIIQWTLKHDIYDLNNDKMMIVRRIFANLGVAFPHGSLDEIISILRSKNYLGWRQCSFNDVQRYADAGVASIGISHTNVIIILPDDKVTNLAADNEIKSIHMDFVKHSIELADEQKNMLFFVYSYGFEFKEE